MNAVAAATLLIFPHNGNGREALDAAGEAYEVLGFIDDTPAKQGVDSLGRAVFGRRALDDYPRARVLAVPGGPASYTRRRALIDGLGIPVERYATVVHRTACVSPSASIGINVLIMAGVVITCGARIGNHVCILPNSVIHHDAVVGDWTLIGANVTIAGGVTVGENCYIGSGTSIINDVRIGDRALVGLGSNVIRAVPDDARMAGNPAREVRKS
jgi:sugar O-acyltransferase (sialic acid O-acetyltransferase NeuD family)